MCFLFWRSLTTLFKKWSRISLLPSSVNSQIKIVFCSFAGQALIPPIIVLGHCTWLEASFPWGWFLSNVIRMFTGKLYSSCPVPFPPVGFSARLLYYDSHMASAAGAPSSPLSAPSSPLCSMFSTLLPDLHSLLPVILCCGCAIFCLALLMVPAEPRVRETPTVALS